MIQKLKNCPNLLVLGEGQFTRRSGEAVTARSRGDLGAGDRGRRPRRVGAGSVLVLLLLLLPLPLQG